MSPAATFRAFRALIPLAALLGGCTYERDVNYKPFFSGLEGAKTQTPATLDPERFAAAPSAPMADESIRTVSKDGKVTLVSRNAQHLMRHILMTLENGERDLFTAQVLSDRTRDEYLQRGLDPGGAFDTLSKRQDDIRELFRRMPIGEHSPNVLMDKLGTGLYRVRLTGRSARDLEWTSFDMSLEGGGRMINLERDGVPVIDKKTGKPVQVMAPRNWKLVWFGR
jgi:hypothetical protein